MEYLILYLVLGVICLPALKINDNKSENVISILSKANYLRGLFAVFAIYTHCTLVFYPLPMLLFPLRKVSTFVVGFFFVMSGYGLAYSFNNKNNYLDGFLSKKLSKIIVPAIVSRVVSEIILYVALDENISLYSILRYMNWYIYSLLVLYIIFYIVYKLTKNRFTRIVGMWAAVILLTFAALIYINNVHDIGRSYYISQWAFVIGLSLYEYRSEFDELMKKYFMAMNVAMVVFLVVTFAFALKADEYTVFDLLSHNLMLLPFFYFVMVACKYFTFDNKILQFLNKISFEIYLYQFAILSVLEEYLGQLDINYFLLSVLITVVLAWIMNSLSRRLMKIVKI